MERISITHDIHLNITSIIREPHKLVHHDKIKRLIRRIKSTY